jgi:hypothetical protein
MLVHTAKSDYIGIIFGLKQENHEMASWRVVCTSLDVSFTELFEIFVKNKEPHKKEGFAIKVLQNKSRKFRGS